MAGMQPPPPPPPPLYHGPPGSFPDYGPSILDTLGPEFVDMNFDHSRAGPAEPAPQLVNLGGRPKGDPSSAPSVSYEAWIFHKADPAPGGKSTWAKARRNLLPSQSEDLEKQLKKQRNASNAAAKQYAKLKDLKQAQIDRLLADKLRDESDPRAEWTLASLKLEERIISRTAKETLSMEAILKRQLRKPPKGKPGKASNSKQKSQGVHVEKAFHAEPARLDPGMGIAGDFGGPFGLPSDFGNPPVGLGHMGLPMDHGAPFAPHADFGMHAEPADDFGQPHCGAEGGSDPIVIIDDDKFGGGAPFLDGPPSMGQGFPDLPPYPPMGDPMGMPMGNPISIPHQHPAQQAQAIFGQPMTQKMSPPRTMPAQPNMPVKPKMSAQPKAPTQSKMPSEPKMPPEPKMPSKSKVSQPMEMPSQLKMTPVPQTMASKSKAQSYSRKLSPSEYVPTSPPSPPKQPASPQKQAEPPKEDIPTTDELSPEQETPEPESPELGSPQMEPPEIEPPKMEPPKVESPKVESPRVKSPEVEFPKMSPQIEPSQAEVPKATLPRGESSEAELSEEELSEEEYSEDEYSEEESSEEELPEQKLPRQQPPKQESPKQESPKREPPKQAPPKFHSPRKEEPAEPPLPAQPILSPRKSAPQPAKPQPPQVSYGRHIAPKDVSYSPVLQDVSERRGSLKAGPQSRIKNEQPAPKVQSPSGQPKVVQETQAKPSRPQSLRSQSTKSQSDKHSVVWPDSSDEDDDSLFEEDRETFTDDSSLSAAPQSPHVPRDHRRGSIYRSRRPTSDERKVHHNSVHREYPNQAYIGYRPAGDDCEEVPEINLREYQSYSHRPYSYGPRHEPPVMPPRHLLSGEAYLPQEAPIQAYSQSSSYMSSQRPPEAPSAPDYGGDLDHQPYLRDRIFRDSPRDGYYGRPQYDQPFDGYYRQQ
ncbi:MAG: hypothetical protein M1819_005126 [Sarea resinae]|nr:MAG: hypothetical protein M1819_005126 [Sarea resinae]